MATNFAEPPPRMAYADKVRLPMAKDRAPADVDAKALARDLSRGVKGEVRFDAGSRAIYATDSSNYRQLPIGVVLPTSERDVLHTIATCRRHGVPIVSRGGGTSLAGQTCNVAVVMDFSKYMNRILEIDYDAKHAWVEPGVVLDDLRDLAEKRHLTFGPDPSTHDRCTLGGMIGNNSCGVHAQMAGKTMSNVLELDVALYDGTRMRVGPTSDEELARILREGGRRAEIYRGLARLRDVYGDLVRERFPEIPRRVSGFNLDQLLPENGFDVARALVGTEATCVTVLKAKVRLVDSPRHRALAILGFHDVFHAGDAVPDVVDAGPIALEGLDDFLIEYMRRKAFHTKDLPLLPDGRGWLLAQFGGDTREEAEARARACAQRIEKLHEAQSHCVYVDQKVRQQVWEIRESGLGATARVPGEKDAWPGWEDSAVPPEKVGPYLRDLRKLFDEFGYKAALYGHFGQGCIHCRVTFDLKTAAGIRRYRDFVERAAHLVVEYGGSLSGEHGDGQSRGELLPIMFGDELVKAFREFKTLWDPDGMMNPGKVVDPYPITSNLRLGSDWEPVVPKLHIQLDQDESFPRATTRCVGVGKCRRHDGGTMCPSYMVTREEMHSTRGRAHMLFEALRGEELDGVRSEHVKEALDLCLACKGCKTECPVNVDMATYKSEFLAHYFDEHLRPPAAYAFGFIDVWAGLASLAPRLANAVSHTEPFATVMKKVLGVAQERSLPRFAPQTFYDWHRGRAPARHGGPPVVLWIDTFNNHFHPETAIAAYRALEQLGYTVKPSPKGLCCGRPLYDYGFLGVAKKRLERIVGALRPDIHGGVPVVGLEPSCTSVFRDELTNLLVGDEDARRLNAQTMTLGELLERGPIRFDALPQLRRKAVVHGHCHHKTVLGFDSDAKTLERLGLDAEVLDSGCCGMAGAFGFEDAKYDVSIAAGERVLLPAVREARRDAIIIADGFSCRTQIAETTERRAMHLAQVLEMALREGPGGPPAGPPEDGYVREVVRKR